MFKCHVKCEGRTWIFLHLTTKNNEICLAGLSASILSYYKILFFTFSSSHLPRLCLHKILME